MPLLRMLIELHIRAAFVRAGRRRFQQITVVIPGAGGFIFSMLLTLSAAILPLFYIKRRGGCAEGKDMEAIQNLVHGGRNGVD